MLDLEIPKDKCMHPTSSKVSKRSNLRFPTRCMWNFPRLSFKYYAQQKHVFIKKKIRFKIFLRKHYLDLDITKSNPCSEEFEQSHRLSCRPTIFYHDNSTLHLTHNRYTQLIRGMREWRLWLSLFIVEDSYLENSNP